MAAGLEPPRQVAAHGFLLLSGEKISKTKLNQISPGEMVEEYGVDPVRYHLLREVPFGPDGDFSGEGLIARYNSDLANNLGNLLSRVATVVGSKCGGIGPAPRPHSPLAPAAATTYQDVAAAWARLAPSEALDATWRLIRETNAHLETTEPWKAEPGPEVEAVLGDALEALRIVTVLASPAMPIATAEIWRRLGLPGTPADQRLPDAAAWGGYPGGLPVEKGPPLFPRRK
jgi:methionyl-tRNA synthetase